MHYIPLNLMYGEKASENAAQKRSAWGVAMDILFIQWK